VDRHDIQPHTRASIRVVTSAGAEELVGWVLASDVDQLSLRTRSGERQVQWSQVTACRSVGVPRGRDPLRVPVGQLSQLAEHADLIGQKFVIRLSQLLDGRDPVPPVGSGVALFGEWAAASGEVELFAAAWWAAQADARNLLVVTDDASHIAELAGLGFAERTP
jgi:hypothetical protein